MQIEKDTNVAVVVRKSWANLYGVRVFLRDGREIRDSHDASHIIVARILDSTDEKGLWITNTGQKEDDPTVKVKGLLVPWGEIYTVILQQKLSPELWAEAQKMGFLSGSF